MIMPILHQLQINIILAVDLKSLLTTYLSSLAKHFCGPMPSSSVAREMFSTAGYRSNRMNICSGVTRIFRPTVGSMMDPVKVITHQSWQWISGSWVKWVNKSRWVTWVTAYGWRIYAL